MLLLTEYQIIIFYKVIKNILIIPNQKKKNKMKISVMKRKKIKKIAMLK